MLDFLDMIGKLKRLERTGWVRSGIKHPESVADHMYRMSVMSACIVNDLSDSDNTINLEHCILMGIAHDMGEALVGDITPHCGVSNEDKHAREESAMQTIRDLLGNDFGVRFYELWHEYEAQTTPESKLVKQFDKLEMIVQAYEYERDQNVNLQEFFTSTVNVEGTFTHPQVLAMVQELVKRRNQLKSDKPDADP
jgi:putative hydrolase of HD superfamily